MAYNPFANIISPELKKTFNNAIDGILSANALTVPCILKYANNATNQICNNCTYDSISKSSSNLYNGTGPSPFPDNTICPVCLGLGVSRNDKEEIVNMAVIFDSKYFLNWSSNTMAIPNGLVQTVCSIDLYYKLKDANEVVFNKNIENLATVTYQRSGEPEPCGFGEHRYIVTLWKNK
jgi:hypothetical protein